VREELWMSPIIEIKRQSFDESMWRKINDTYIWNMENGDE
jgi:hypothetical protein